MGGILSKQSAWLLGALMILGSGFVVSRLHGAIPALVGLVIVCIAVALMVKYKGAA